ncbi:MAG TPA: hypothetical protein VFX98_07090 [Longimicrobiaceae bacterium]|nr:hypothetical protein [Longimicrobiaceae bacterium]
MLRALYLLFGAATLANAAWMLASPETWYARFPAGVPDTGPLNRHLVRDVGVAFAVCGAGLVWCAANLRRCYPVHVGIAAFFVGHALLHAFDLASGHLPRSHVWSDLPTVFLPALALGVLALPGVWRRAAG